MISLSPKSTTGSYERLFQFFYLFERVIRLQYGSSYQDTACAPFAHSSHICRGFYTRFAHDRDVIGYVLNKFLRCFDIDFERFEVPVVYADESGSTAECLFDLFGVVYFEEMIEVERLGKPYKFYKVLLAQDVRYQEECICAAKKRFVHLVFVYDEILAQNGLRHPRTHLFEQFQRAAEIWFVGKDRNNIRAALRLEVGDLKRRPCYKFTGRRGSGLYLGDENRSALKELSERSSFLLVILGFFLQFLKRMRGFSRHDLLAFFRDYFIQNTHWCSILAT